MARAAADIGPWLIAQGLARTPVHAVVAGFCRHLATAGLTLARAVVGVTALHPRVATRSFVWRPDGAVLTQSFDHDLSMTDDWRSSPWSRMLEDGLGSLRLRLCRDPGDTGFPLVETLRRQGVSDYLALGVAFGEPGTRRTTDGILSSWATYRPGGFAPHQTELLERLFPALALAVAATQTHDNAINLLDTYVGPNAGRRILAGEVRPGSVEVIRAALWWADLRGFTALSQTAPRESLVPMLNDYLACLVEPVTAAGGQVLKFMGDGLIATFEFDGATPQTACTSALAAAEAALDRVAALNRSRQAAGQPVMPLDLALHLGEVLFGNVGAADRLDFTMIGPAVNEVARIEQLCGVLDHPILMSEDFARAALAQTEHIVSVGRHRLRGVDQPRALYTLRRRPSR